MGEAARCSRPRTRAQPTYAATPDFPSTVDDISGSLGRGGYEGIQNDSDGNLWIVEDIGGAEQVRDRPRSGPNSFIYRYVPATPGDLQQRQAAGAAGAERRRPADHVRRARRRSKTRTRSRCTPTATFKTKWITDPRHRRGRQRAVQREHAGEGGAGDAVQAAGERATSGPARTSVSSSSTRPATPTRPAPRTTAAGGWGSVFKLTQCDPSADTRHALAVLQGRRGPHRPRQHRRSCRRTRSPFVEDAGRHAAHRSATRSTRASSSTSNRLLERRRTQPVRWLAEGATPRRRSTPPTAASARTTATTRSPASYVSDGDPGTDGILGAKSPQLFDDQAGAGSTPSSTATTTPTR